MKHLFQILMRYIVRIIVCVIVATALLTIVHMIPFESLYDQLAESVAVFDYEGTYPSLYKWCVSTLDNYTDAIMLSEVNYVGKNPFISALESNIYASVDLDPVQSYIRMFWKDLDYDYVYSYSRYWHGYLVFLKPLFVFFNYATIRKINSIVQLGLISVLFMLFVQCKDKKFILPFLIAYLMAVPAALMKSLQFSNCFYVMLIGCIVLMLLKKWKVKKEKYYFLFLYLGIATSFFDLLTFPIITFGVPCLIFILMKSENHPSFWDVCKTGVSWGVGYFGMWFSKWIMASIFTEKNVIADAFSSIIERLSHTNSATEIEYTMIDSLTFNFRNYFDSPVTILFWLTFIVLVMLILKKKKNNGCFLNIEKILTSALVTLLPVGWYICIVNHSTIHAWFTKNGCFVVVFGVLSILLEILDVDGLNFSELKNNLGRINKHEESI